MAQKWNLQDIRPPERTKKQSPKSMQSDTESTSAERESSLGNPRRLRQRGGGRRYVVIGLIVIVAAGAIFAATALMRGAKVTVYPKFRDVTVQATFTATKQPLAGELGYELLTLEEEGERTVLSSGEEEVEERAAGEITIYNEYSTNSQRLIKNTRFESPEGLVFRIPESVDVPGFTRAADDSVVPGSITVEVFADATGDEYNIGPARFTVPGLEGTDQFESIYAESTENMRGGFEGLKLIVEETELESARSEMQSELRERLMARLAAERPAGVTAFDDAVVFVFEALPSTQSGEDSVTLHERGRLVVPVFSDAAFAGYIAENTVAGYEGVPVRIENADSIAFAYASTSRETFMDSESMDFALSGDARIIWNYDHEQLRNDLAGVGKTALPTILSGYPAIERAEAVVRPFWKQSFPDSAEDIEIMEVVEGG